MTPCGKKGDYHSVCSQTAAVSLKPSTRGAKGRQGKVMRGAMECRVTASRARRARRHIFSASAKDSACDSYSLRWWWQVGRWNARRCSGPRIHVRNNHTNGNRQNTVKTRSGIWVLIFQLNELIVIIPWVLAKDMRFLLDATLPFLAQGRLTVMWGHTWVTQKAHEAACALGCRAGEECHCVTADSRKSSTVLEAGTLSALPLSCLLQAHLQVMMVSFFCFVKRVISKLQKHN